MDEMREIEGILTRFPVINLRGHSVEHGPLLLTQTHEPSEPTVNP